jgi:hypothetical protein
MLFADSKLRRFSMPSVNDILATRRKLLLREISLEDFKKEIQGFRDDYCVATFLQRFTDTNKVSWRGDGQDAIHRFWKENGFKYVSWLSEYYLPDKPGDLLLQAQHFGPDDIKRIDIYYNLVTKGYTRYS